MTTLMMATKVRFIVHKFLKEAGTDPSGVDDDANLLELGYIDSEAFFDLVFLLEEETGMDIDFIEVDPADLVSIAGLARHLASIEVGRCGSSSSATDYQQERP